MEIRVFDWYNGNEMIQYPLSGNFFSRSGIELLYDFVVDASIYDKIENIAILSFYYDGTNLEIECSNNLIASGVLNNKIYANLDIYKQNELYRGFVVIKNDHKFLKTCQNKKIYFDNLYFDISVVKKIPEIVQYIKINEHITKGDVSLVGEKGVHFFPMEDGIRIDTYYNYEDCEPENPCLKSINGVLPIKGNITISAKDVLTIRSIPNGIKIGSAIKDLELVRYEDGAKGDEGNAGGVGPAGAAGACTIAKSVCCLCENCNVAQGCNPANKCEVCENCNLCQQCNMPEGNTIVCSPCNNEACVVGDTPSVEFKINNVENMFFTDTSNPQYIDVEGLFHTIDLIGREEPAKQEEVIVHFYKDNYTEYLGKTTKSNTCAITGNKEPVLFSENSVGLAPQNFYKDSVENNKVFTFSQESWNGYFSPNGYPPVGQTLIGTDNVELVVEEVTTEGVHKFTPHDGSSVAYWRQTSSANTWKDFVYNGGNLTGSPIEDFQSTYYGSAFALRINNIRFSFLPIFNYMVHVFNYLTKEWLAVTTGAYHSNNLYIQSGKAAWGLPPDSPAQVVLIERNWNYNGQDYTVNHWVNGPQLV